MLVSRAGWLGSSIALAAALLLVGCGTSLNRAPVEDRGTAVGGVSASPGQVVDAPKLLPGAENAGKPGYYSVKPGDTLIRIGLENGQSWKDIARWNNLENPNLIEVGQVLRVVSPGAAVAAAPVPPAVVGGDTGVVTRPVGSPAVAPAAGAAAPVPAPVPAPAAASTEDGVAFVWPASGSLLAGFDEARNKGYDIGGKVGDPVLAAADGRVVYAGAGLRGYGNLVILKHNNTYLTAYAHNQTLLVKEDQSVRKGQKIAEMGSTDADRVKLHFEIRRQGKPVDPSRYLPAR
ncbi:peptidoglycan DD-metalloendopeptidase family protein [Acidovorax sp. HDW3]|uniref:peptidoglycan DD-metalloendopeptidase family protein n=1 Tax=Acidovorax sp. HDW3 TaxID=2714923 RepID=UPI00140A1909|nr:peptidoglycan DD-metalloendopeptidase family protein [Acidovorax sp. HDW3]QIL43446.1 peptidoglycan DD-metalloendopeptidase family protein [Acidovorax sp. HDW3]